MVLRPTRQTGVQQRYFTLSGSASKIVDLLSFNPPFVTFLILQALSTVVVVPVQMHMNLQETTDQIIDALDKASLPNTEQTWKKALF